MTMSAARPTTCIASSSQPICISRRALSAIKGSESAVFTMRAVISSTRVSRASRNTPAAQATAPATNTSPSDMSLNVFQVLGRDGQMDKPGRGQHAGAERQDQDSHQEQAEQHAGIQQPRGHDEKMLPFGHLSLPMFCSILGFDNMFIDIRQVIYRISII